MCWKMSNYTITRSSHIYNVQAPHYKCSTSYFHGFPSSIWIHWNPSVSEDPWNMASPGNTLRSTALPKSINTRPFPTADPKLLWQLMEEKTEGQLHLKAGIATCIMDWKRHQSKKTQMYTKSTNYTWPCNTRYGYCSFSLLFLQKWTDRGSI